MPEHNNYFDHEWQTCLIDVGGYAVPDGAECRCGAHLTQEQVIEFVNRHWQEYGFEVGGDA